MRCGIVMWYGLSVTSVSGCAARCNGMYAISSYRALGLGLRAYTIVEVLALLQSERRRRYSKAEAGV